MSIYYPTRPRFHSLPRQVGKCCQLLEKLFVPPIDIGGSRRGGRLCSNRGYFSWQDQANLNGAVFLYIWYEVSSFIDVHRCVTSNSRIPIILSSTRPTYSEVGQITYETLDDIFRQIAGLDLSQDISFSFTPVLFAMTSSISPRYLFEILRNTHSDCKLAPRHNIHLNVIHQDM